MAAFGDGGLYLERFVGTARHVEVQILGDGTRAIHTYERECSLQRRRQKVWEEAPAACLTPEVREALCASAVRLAESVGYRGAGTLEYLYDAATGEFFFIEMNTRIQVEHPVSEMITGIDLVREMIRIAAGNPLAYAQGDVRLKGHAIEVRINAEDAAKNFLPAPGTITGLRVPGGMGVRFDSMLYPGYSVPPFYDSLLGKLIVWDETRAGAIATVARPSASSRSPACRPPRRCTRRSPPTPRSRPAPSTPAGSKLARNPPDRQSGVLKPSDPKPSHRRSA